MALATITDAKAYLRINGTAEDTVLTFLLARAKASIERTLGYALTAGSRTHIDYDERNNDVEPSVLRLPGPFAVSGSAPVVTARDGEEIDAESYYLDPRAGLLRGKDGYRFCARPYTIVATIGLSAHPDYAAILESIANGAILDLVAHLHLRRDPSVAAETDEGGRALSMEGLTEGQPPLPRRVREALTLLPNGARLFG